MNHKWSWLARDTLICVDKKSLVQTDLQFNRILELRYFFICRMLMKWSGDSFDYGTSPTVFLSLSMSSLFIPPFPRYSLFSYQRGHPFLLSDHPLPVCERGPDIHSFFFMSIHFRFFPFNFRISFFQDASSQELSGIARRQKEGLSFGRLAIHIG